LTWFLWMWMRLVMQEKGRHANESCLISNVNTFTHPSSTHIYIWPQDAQPHIFMSNVTDINELCHKHIIAHIIYTHLHLIYVAWPRILWSCLIWYETWLIIIWYETWLIINQKIFWCETWLIIKCKHVMSHIMHTHHLTTGCAHIWMSHGTHIHE